MKSTIIALEKKYWNAMAEKDYEVVKELTKFPCIVAGKKGVMSVDEPTFKKMFEQGNNISLEIKNIWDEKVQGGDDHAMIGYLMESNYDGKLMKCACTSTWVKENEEWVCAMHTETDLDEQ